MHHSYKKLYAVLFPFFLFLLHLPFVFANVKPIDSGIPGNKIKPENHIFSAKHSLDNLYSNLSLKELGLSQKAFDYAIQGYQYFRSKGMLDNEEVLTIIDFSLPSNKKRLFVIDVAAEKILFHTYVAHGRNSGKLYAKNFSNTPASFKSSLGFYITKKTYYGDHGFSLRLEGEEDGINDNAMSRAIVMHSADYVNKKLIKSQGYIGRSLGCPALPKEVYKPIIQKIKNGSCLFIYSPSERYENRSKIIQPSAS